MPHPVQRPGNLDGRHQRLGENLIQQDLTGPEHGKANADAMLTNANAMLADKY
jgi:hypothetical protein